jgi:threonine/homoserine/homoserine lactone efflux protein
MVPADCFSELIMNADFFVRGVIIGFSIAAPVGPIGVLCIRRTLAAGRTAGLVSGFGAATADAVYGFVAGFGLTFISTFLIRQKMWLGIVGGLFLCYLGIRTFLAKPAEQAASSGGARPIAAYTSTFFLTLTNPMTVLFFAAIFAGLGIGSTTGNYVSAGVLVTGVFTGSALWWIFLSVGVSVIRSAFNPRRLRWVNRLSGVIITGFGLFALFGVP